MTYLLDDRGRIFSLLSRLLALSENHSCNYTISSFDGYSSYHEIDFRISHYNFRFATLTRFALLPVSLSILFVCLGCVTFLSSI